jgi:hypothetical protein
MKDTEWGMHGPGCKLRPSNFSTLLYPSASFSIIRAFNIIRAFCYTMACGRVSVRQREWEVLDNV